MLIWDIKYLKMLINMNIVKRTPLYKFLTKSAIWSTLVYNKFANNKHESEWPHAANAGGAVKIRRKQPLPSSWIVPDAKGETLLAFAEKILLEAVQSIVMLNRRHNKKPVFDHLLACSVWAPYKTIAELGT